MLAATALDAWSGQDENKFNTHNPTIVRNHSTASRRIVHHDTWEEGSVIDEVWGYPYQFVLRWAWTIPGKRLDPDSCRSSPLIFLHKEMGTQNESRIGQDNGVHGNLHQQQSFINSTYRSYLIECLMMHFNTALTYMRSPFCSMSSCLSFLLSMLVFRLLQVSQLDITVVKHTCCSNCWCGNDVTPNCCKCQLQARVIPQVRHS